MANRIGNGSVGQERDDCVVAGYHFPDFAISFIDRLRIVAVRVCMDESVSDDAVCLTAVTKVEIGRRSATVRAALRFLPTRVGNKASKG